MHPGRPIRPGHATSPTESGLHIIYEPGPSQSGCSENHDEVDCGWRAEI